MEDVQLFNDINVNILIQEDSDSDSDSDDSYYTSQITSKKKHDKVHQAVKTYAAKFKSKLKSNSKKSSYQVKKNKVNPLMPPPIKEEGRRDKNSVKLEKYFGIQSRQEFFGRANWIRDKGNVMNKGDNIAEKTVLTPKDDYSTDFAFAPRRFDDLEDDVEEEGEGDDNEESEVWGKKQQLDAATTYTSAPTNRAMSVSSVSTIASASTLHTTRSVIEKGAPTSPRTRYIGNCINSQINPRASLILRKRVSTELNLSHQGMGDKMGIIFAQSLKELPFVHTLDLTDNNLTDVGLYPIIMSVISLPNLTNLNLSNNIVDGESSKALATYLSTPSCALERLIMQNADVDDEECQMFVASLMASHNLNFKELDLSKNIIGKSENLNTVMPDLITGGEALADLLSANTCHLDTLRLGWNMIRLDGAKEFAESLAETMFLTDLDLSYNALGKEAGEILGKSLITNKSLRLLNISNNNINSTACFTICVALEENKTLHSLILDGNPIGELGFTLTSQIPVVIGGRLKVSTDSCNTRIRDSEDHKIDINNIADSYVLDMSRPFERAIFFKILNTASRNRSISVEKCYLTSPQTGKEMNIKFIRTPSDAKIKALSEGMKLEIMKLRKIEEIAQDVALAERLFLAHDADDSGGLDADELESVVKSLGLSIERHFIELTIKKYDIDGGGVLELAEFLEFLSTQKEDATARIRELTECFTVTSTKDPDNRYIPPLDGSISMLVTDAYMSAGATVVSSEEHNFIMDIAQKAKEGQQQIVEYGIKGAKIRSKEAFAVYHFMLAEVRSPALVLEKLLPVLINYSEARIFVQQTIQNDPLILKRLRQTMGGCLNVILGHFNGWYSLDLSQEYDRICLAKLLEQSQSMKEQMLSDSVFEYGITGDVSQLGDWSSFRNVIVDGKFGIITTEMFNPMGHHGKLQFDFSGSDKTDYKASIISDKRVVNCLVLHGIVSSSSKAQTFNSLNMMKKECDAHFLGDGTFNNDCDERKAKNIQTHMLRFYANLLKRSKFARKGQLLEETKLELAKGFLAAQKNTVREEDLGDIVSSDGSDVSDSDNDNENGNDEVVVEKIVADRKVSASESIRKVPGRGSKSVIQKNSSPFADKDRDSSENIQLTRRKTNPVLLKNHKIKSFAINEECVQSEDLDGEMKKMKKNKNGKFIACWKIVNLIFEIFKHSWLRCRHLAVLVTHFHHGQIKRTKFFGSYRVEMIVMLFHRLTDVQNFDLITKRLAPFEVACLYCRLGYLKLFNPMKPEGAHFLNISNREERVITKIMGALSTLEPGENWIDETFQWELDMDVIPGWVLTQTWMTDEGMPPRGFLFVVYYSGEGKHLNGTLPNIPVRKSFYHMCGIDEKDLFRDESNLIMEKQSIDTPSGKRDALRVVRQIYSKLDGRKCALDHRSLWEVFLTPLNSTSARIARGEKVLSVFEEIRAATGKDPFNLHFVDPPKIIPKVAVTEPSDRVGKTPEKGKQRESVIKQRDSISTKTKPLNRSRTKSEI